MVSITSNFSGTEIVIFGAVEESRQESAEAGIYDIIVVVEGTLYPLLTRLKNSGYLEYYWMESNSGPPRKYFKITVAGLAFLQELKEAWVQINDAILLTTQSPATVTT